MWSSDDSQDNSGRSVYLLDMFLGTGVGGSAGAGVLVVVVLIISFYFIPTIVAMARKVTNTGSVFVINLLLGWTLVGWAVALAMAVKTKVEQVTLITTNVTANVPGPKMNTELRRYCASCGNQV